MGLSGDPRFSLGDTGLGAEATTIGIVPTSPGYGYIKNFRMPPNQVGRHFAKAIQLARRTVIDHAKARAKVLRDNTGVAAEMPVIITVRGPLEPLVDYFLVRRHVRSWSWMEKVVQAVRLLLDYMEANQYIFNNPKDIFNTFVQRLYSGTIGDDGLDPSGLYWMPRHFETADRLIGSLSEFSDWMASRLKTKPLNPFHRASGYEERLNWVAWHQKHNRSFLAHTWDRYKADEINNKSRYTPTRRKSKTNLAGVKYFPENHIFDLLFKGFVRCGKQNEPDISKRLNLRDILITILQHGGAVRVSEPFHLYVHDVTADPFDRDIALVRIYHPEEGEAPPDWFDKKGKPIKCNRAAYLRGKYGMRARTQYPKGMSLHAGWKAPMLDDEKKNYMQVHWFPRYWGKLFKQLWGIYLYQLVGTERNHPFAFVSFQPNTLGRPYAIDAYRENHEAAIKRIGLIAAKMEGTTPHGHRHAAGQRLDNAGVDPQIKQHVLHHKSIESQLVYTEPSINKVTRILNDATALLENGLTAPRVDFTAYGLEGIDPLGLFSGPRPLLRRTSLK